MGSSGPRDRTRVPCTARQTLNDWTASEAPNSIFKTFLADKHTGKNQSGPRLPSHTEGPSERPRAAVPRGGGAPRWSPCSPADTARGPEEGHRHIHSLTVLDAPHPNQPHILWSLVPTLWPAQNPFLQASVSHLKNLPSSWDLEVAIWIWVAICSLFSVSLHLLPHRPFWAHGFCSLG